MILIKGRRYNLIDRARFFRYNVEVNLRTGLFCLLLPLCGLALAAPTTTTTRAATVPVDQSTPRGALKLLASALESGDRDAILKILHAKNATETKIASATADLAAANAALRAAAVKAFGEEGAKRLVAGSLEESFERIDTATEKIDGDSATVNTTEDDPAPLKLARVNNKWVIPLKDVAANADPAEVERSLSDVQMQVKLLEGMAEQIAQKKFKSADEARQALDREVMASVVKSTTAPTTSP